MIVTQEKTTTQTAEISLDHGIVILRILPTHQSSVEEAQTNLEAIHRITAGRAYPYILDLRAAMPLTKAVRAVYNNANHRALAILVNSSLSCLIGNIVFTTDTIQVFTEESVAYNWVNIIKSENLS